MILIAVRSNVEEVEPTAMGKRKAKRMNEVRLTFRREVGGMCDCGDHGSVEVSEAVRFSCTPGEATGSPMNSMPWASSAVLIFSSVPEREGGTPAATSNLCIVRRSTPDSSESSVAEIPSKLLAARICDAEIIDATIFVS
ncbi:MAG: hypothetical protein AAFY27_09850 [Pseudomonadota bacterium]